MRCFRGNQESSGLDLRWHQVSSVTCFWLPRCCVTKGLKTEQGRGQWSVVTFAMAWEWEEKHPCHKLTLQNPVVWKVLCRIK